MGKPSSRDEAVGLDGPEWARAGPHLELVSSASGCSASRPRHFPLRWRSFVPKPRRFRLGPATAGGTR